MKLKAANEKTTVRRSAITAGACDYLGRLSIVVAGS